MSRAPDSPAGRLNPDLGVRSVEKCCGTCRFSGEIFGEWSCDCPAFYGGDHPCIDAGCICPRWEAAADAVSVSPVVGVDLGAGPSYAVKAEVAGGEVVSVTREAAGYPECLVSGDEAAGEIEEPYWPLWRGKA